MLVQVYVTDEESVVVQKSSYINDGVSGVIGKDCELGSDAIE